MSGSSQRWAIGCATLVAATAFGRAAAAQDAPPPEDDAWQRAVKTGVAQESHAAEDAARAKEIAALELIRKGPRFVPYLGLGYAAGFARQYGAYPRDVRLTAQGVDFELGAGVRWGLGGMWEMQARASFLYLNVEQQKNSSSYCSFSDSDGASSSSSPTCSKSGYFGASLDWTTRIHAFSPRSPVYLGLGARIAFVFGEGSKTTTQTTGSGSTALKIRDVTSSSSALVAYPMAVLEAGVLLGQREEWDLGLRGGVGNGGMVTGVVGRAF